MTTLIKNCNACGDMFTVRLADHKRGWGNSCSKACSAAYKCGQRPRDVNAAHAKSSPWAAERWATLSAKYPQGQPPKAPSVQSQVGKVKVRPAYHSPAPCWECGKRINGPGLCDECEADEQARSDCEAGWDGHKVWAGG